MNKTHVFLMKHAALIVVALIAFVLLHARYSSFKRAVLAVVDNNALPDGTVLPVSTLNYNPNAQAYGALADITFPSYYGTAIFGRN